MKSAALKFRAAFMFLEAGYWFYSLFLSLTKHNNKQKQCIYAGI